MVEACQRGLKVGEERHGGRAVWQGAKGRGTNASWHWSSLLTLIVQGCSCVLSQVLQCKGVVVLAITTVSVVLRKLLYSGVR